MVTASRTTHHPRRALALWLACAAGVAGAQPAAAPEWNYRVVAGDHLIAIARNFLKPEYGWEALQQRNQLRDPNVIGPGSTIVIPVAWLRQDAGVAEVVFARGDVIARASAGADPAPLRAGDKLAVGAAVVTGEQSSVTLRLADGSRLLLTPRTQVALERLLVYGRSGLAESDVRLDQGVVEVDVPARGSPVPPVQVRTPVATLGVRGTEFRAGARPSGGASRVEVLQGRVAAKADREVAVGAGFGLVARANQPIGEPRPLLPAPDLAAVPGVVMRLPVDQAWPAVPDATAYRAQLFGDAQATRLLEDRTVTSAQVQWDTLADGAYWLRVRGVAADGLEGIAATRAFELAPPPEPAPLPAAPAEGDRVTGPTVTLAWTTPSPAARFRLQVAANPDFASPAVDLPDVGPGRYNLVQHTLALPAGRWYWRVMSFGTSGRASPYGETRSFTLLGAGR
jgi:hypothetical protein